MKTLIVFLIVILLGACGVKKDIVMQEPTTAVSTEVKSLAETKQTETSITGNIPQVVIETTQYKKFQDIEGVDWKKMVQFSFKDEDISKVLDFLSQASGLTIINVGSEVPVSATTDPQAVNEAMQQLLMRQQYYQPQQQQQKQETTKKISPVSGNVTIYSKGKVTLEEAFKILDSVLLGKGYTSVLTGKVLKIIPISGVRQSNLKVVVNSDPKIAPDGDDVVAQIVLLKNLTAAKLRSDLANLVPIWGLILSNEAANAIILINNLSNIKSMLQIIDNLDKAATKAVGVSVYELRYADAKKLADVLNEVFRGITSQEGRTQQQQQQQLYGARGLTAQETEKIAIVDDEKTNSIIAVASPQTLALIKSTIEQLDRIQNQVLVEVLVVDVTLTSDLQLGVEWTFTGSPVRINTSELEGSSNTLSSNLQLSGKVPSFTYTLLKDQSKILLHNLMKETKVDVKAAPRILTLDNQKAIVNVGQEIPTLTGSQTTSSGQVIYTYKYDKVGVILEVTPHINQDNFVSMNIKQTVSKITETTYFGAPVLDNREATTSVRVKDGETMVLGGIITDKASLADYKIPILGDVPLLGFLFRSQQKTTEKTELLLFLTPHVINTSKESVDKIKLLNENIEKRKTD